MLASAASHLSAFTPRWYKSSLPPIGDAGKTTALPYSVSPAPISESSPPPRSTPRTTLITDDSPPSHTLPPPLPPPTTSSYPPATSTRHHRHHPYPPPGHTLHAYTHPLLGSSPVLIDTHSLPSFYSLWCRDQCNISRIAAFERRCQCLFWRTRTIKWIFCTPSVWAMDRSSILRVMFRSPADLSPKQKSEDQEIWRLLCSASVDVDLPLMLSPKGRRAPIWSVPAQHRTLNRLVSEKGPVQSLLPKPVLSSPVYCDCETRTLLSADGRPDGVGLVVVSSVCESMCVCVSINCPWHDATSCRSLGWVCDEDFRIKVILWNRFATVVSPRIRVIVFRVTMVPLAWSNYREYSWHIQIRYSYFRENEHS